MGHFVAQNQDERLASGQQSFDGEQLEGATRGKGELEKPERPQEVRQEVATHDEVSKISSSAIRLNEKNQQEKSRYEMEDEEKDRKWWRRTRIHVALLGLAIAVVNCYAQATFCIAIVEMVLPADFVDMPTNQLANLSNTTRPPNKLAATDTLILEDQSCPIEFKYRNYYDSWRFGNSNSSSPTTRPADNQNGSQQIGLIEQVVDTSNRFNWDASQQGLLLGAFAVGTAPLQIIGGRMAEIYGSKWVLLMACIGTGLTNLAIPHLAHFNLFLLIANRILMGVAQAGMEPGLMCLLADWLTPQEASFFISMLLCALCLGFFLGSLCSSFFLALGYGWPLTYYVCGGLNLLVALIWYLYADSWPRASKHISRQELAYIEHEQARTKKLLRVDGNSIEHFQTTSLKPTDTMGVNSNQMESAAVQEDPLKAPWLNILSSRPVWAFIICKISIRWCADVISNELPTYLANVLHLSIKINGLLNSVSCALFAISSFLTGWLATSNMFNAPPKTCCLAQNHSSGTNVVANNSKCLECQRNQQSVNETKTNLRRCFQSLASFGSAICLILMTRYDCDILISMSCLLLLSWFIVMGTGGELQIAYDMTSRYPGTLHGMACTLSVSGWLAPPLYGLILGDQPSSRSRWSIVWYSTAAINVLGGLVFVLFADASPQDFDRPRKSSRRRATDLENVVEHDGSYCNGALSSSSCESSPKSAHQPSKQIKPKDKLAAFQPVFTTFDCDQPIRCRQLESSFTKANPLGGRLDSPLWLEADDLIYPYCEKQPNRKANETADLMQHSSIWRRLASLLTRQCDKAKLSSETATPPPPAQNQLNESIRRLANGHTETINQSRGSHKSRAGFRSELGSSKSEAELDAGRLKGGEHLIESRTAAAGSLPYGTPSAGATTGVTDGDRKDQQLDSNTLLPAEATCQKTITHL